MVSEKIIFNFDILELKRQVAEIVLKYPPVMVGPHFGGWSVLSSNGLYTDGWAAGQNLYRADFMPNATLAEKANALGIKKSSDYCVETEICTGYLKTVIDTVRATGLQPRRARLSLLKSNGESTLHRDAKDSEYAVRLQIPIITNTDCIFSCEQGQEHFAADGNGYFIFVNRLHQIFNRGPDDRIHLIMDVTDHKNITQFHRKTSG